jgi:hypothetical protein
VLELSRAVLPARPWGDLRCCAGLLLAVGTATPAMTVALGGGEPEDTG